MIDTSPALLLRGLLIAQGVLHQLSDAGLAAACPCYLQATPAALSAQSGQDCTLFDTNLQMVDRLHNNDAIERYYVQLSFRSKDYAKGFARTTAVWNSMCSSVKLVLVLNGVGYYLGSIQLGGDGIHYLGLSQDDNHAHQSTINVSFILKRLDDWSGMDNVIFIPIP